MKRTFFARRALPIMMLLFFLLPFAFRGARMAVQRMKNDVKDWLPSHFTETQQLDWFRAHFLGEQFIVVSWDGCTEEDASFRLFQQKLLPEMPPSQRVDAGQSGDSDGSGDSVQPDGDHPQTGTPSGDGDADLQPLANRMRQANIAASKDPSQVSDFIGDRLGLFMAAEDYENWYGQKEKWLQGKFEHWYYITPSGDLYRWSGSDAPLAMLWRSAARSFFNAKLEGEHVASFGADGPWYYANPRRLNARYFKTVTTGPAILHSLTEPGGVLADNSDEALARLNGTLFGPDGKQTCLVLTLSDSAKQDLHRVLGRGMLGRPRGRLLDLAEESGIPPQRLRLGGPPVDNVAIDEEGTITLVRLVGLCAVLGIGLAYVCMRSLKLTLMVFFVGGASAVLAMAFVWWLGSSVDAVMMSMPALVYVLGLSGAIHIINYYRDAVRESGIRGAPEKALAHGWIPCTLCSVTTALGMLSLYTSEIQPIRKFGLFAAIGVVATLGILFTFLPAALELFPPRLRSRTAGDENDEPVAGRRSSRFWRWYASVVVRYNGWIVASGLIVFGIFAFGMTQIRTSVQILKMFDQDAKIISDYTWLENNLGKLVPMEVVIKVDPQLVLPPAFERQNQTPDAADDAVRLSFLERLEIVDRVSKVVDEQFGPRGRDVAGRTMSAVTFAPILPKPKGDTLTFARRGATNSRLELHRDEFLHSDFLRLDQQDQSELWRVSVRLGALQNVDYGQFVGQLKNAIEPVLAAYRERENILSGLVKQRDGVRAVGASVLVLGAPIDKDTEAASATLVVSDVASESMTSRQHQSEIGATEQTEIFSETLYDLLNVARLKLDWYDPAAGPLPGDWIEQLPAYDCVVVVGDEDAYDLEAIRQHGKLVIDARDHQFDADTMNITSSESAHVSAVYTGVVPLVYKAQRTLLENLTESVFWSFVMVGGCMIILLTPGQGIIQRLRPTHLGLGVVAGLVSMIANMFPLVLIFGAIGWSGAVLGAFGGLPIEIDIGSMMTASVALGIAVDDTIHFLTWFRWGLNQGMDRKRAIIEAYQRCGSAMCQTTLIGGLGMFIFAASTFTPTKRFGVLMLALLTAALVGDLLIGPALYSGPLGYFFRPRRKESTAPSGKTQLQPTSTEPPATPAGPAKSDHPSTPHAVRKDALHRSPPR